MKGEDDRSPCGLCKQAGKSQLYYIDLSVYTFEERV
jgi:hypothetical protein